MYFSVSVLPYISAYTRFFLRIDISIRIYPHFYVYISVSASFSFPVFIYLYCVFAASDTARTAFSFISLFSPSLYISAVKMTYICTQICTGIRYFLCIYFHTRIYLFIRIDFCTGTLFLFRIYI